MLDFAPATVIARDTLVSLSEIALDKIEAGEDPTKMFYYVTQRKAEPFKQVVGKKKEDEILSHRCEFSPKECPNDAVLLSIGIDMQHKSFWYAVRAWCANKTSYMIDYRQIHTWDELQAICFMEEYKKTNGQMMGIWRGLLDTGGTKDKDSFISRTEEAYRWLRINGNGKIFGYKGANRAQDKNIIKKKMDTYPNSNKLIPGGLELVKVNPNAMKDILQWRLFREDGESGQFFLHNETGMDYAKQFISQELRKDKFGKTEWVTIGNNDHLKDCENMNEACVDDSWIPSFTMIVNYLNKPAKPKRVKKPNQQEQRKRRW